MATVRSMNALVNLDADWAPTNTYGSMLMYDVYYRTYAELYSQQPNIRTCVDFLARNIAQLGLHVYRRVSDTDRQRLTDHPLAKVINRPNPYTTRYRLIESLMVDLGIYYNAYWLKIPGNPYAVLRIPPEMVTVHGGLVPTRYDINFSKAYIQFPPDEIVHFRGQNPGNPIVGLSPMETLRRVLAEEYAMGEYRENFWRNSARMNGIIQRPAEAPNWTELARERFKSEFESLYSGGENSGRTAILEEGMTWKETTFSAQESEYLAARKLTREECARSYHIPLPMVGILDHATFSNIAEQHKNLYQDSLGPWLAMIEQEIELQLLPSLGDANGVYCEFNIAEKMQGSFEEQVKAFQAAVGRPWMTADEARARNNMPSLGGDAARLVTPMNVTVGGLASPQDTAPKGHALQGAPAVSTKAAKRIDTEHVQLREQHIKKWQEILSAYFRRQAASITARVPAKARKGIGEVWGDQARWNSELQADILRLNILTANAWAKRLADQVEADYDEDLMLPWLAENSRIAAENINWNNRQKVMEALGDDDPLGAVRRLFEIAATSGALEIATSKVTTAANFGSHEVAKQSNLRSKTWNDNSSNPRSQHAAMDGETVGIDELFSNGAMWPGDPALGAEENANCGCSVSFGR